MVGQTVALAAVLSDQCVVRDFTAAETVLGKGDWMDQIVLRDGLLFKDGYFALPDKAGLGVELNREVVEAHLATGEKWWGK